MAELLQASTEAFADSTSDGSSIIEIAPEPEMDEVHLDVWHAVRHLFPADAVATEPKPGWINVTWSIDGNAAADADAESTYATPVLLKIEHPLLNVMWSASSERRYAIATRQEATVRAGMMGYNPRASLPNLRVVVLG
jgi:hypothetical protein